MFFDAGAVGNQSRCDCVFFFMCTVDVCVNPPVCVPVCVRVHVFCLFSVGRCDVLFV